jgi:hypothetical protein
VEKEGDREPPMNADKIKEKILATESTENTEEKVTAKNRTVD